MAANAVLKCCLPKMRPLPFDEGELDVVPSPTFFGEDICPQLPHLARNNYRLELCIVRHSLEEWDAVENEARGRGNNMRITLT